jgi:hypothetical protein
MAQIAAGALALGVAVEHFRPNLPAPLLDMRLTRKRGSGVAMFGAAAIVVAAAASPGPVAPLTFMLARYTGSGSSLITAGALGALYYVGSTMVHDMILDPVGSGVVAA